MKRAALLGAILVHPVLFAGFWLFGVLFGARDAWNMDRAPIAGVPGGSRAVGNLLTGYFITAGLVALIVTVFGAALGVASYWTFRRFASKPADDKGGKSTQS